MIGSNRLQGKSLKDSGLLVDSDTGYRVDKDGQIIKLGAILDEPTGYYLNAKGELVKNGMIFDNPTGLKLDDSGEIVRTGVLWDKPSGLRVNENGELSERGFLSETRVDWKDGVETLRDLPERTPEREQDGDEPSAVAAEDNSTGWSPPYVPPVYESASMRSVLPVAMTAVSLFTWLIVFPEIGGENTSAVRGPLISYGAPVIFVWYEYVLSFNTETDGEGRHRTSTLNNSFHTMGVGMLLACWALAFYYSLATSPNRGTREFLSSILAIVGSVPVLGLYWGGLLYGSLKAILELPNFIKGCRQMLAERRAPQQKR